MAAAWLDHVAVLCAGHPDYNYDIDAPLMHYNDLPQQLERECQQYVVHVVGYFSKK